MNRQESGKLGYKVAKERLDARWQKLKDDYYVSPRVCKQCNSVLPYGTPKKSHFCNHSCAAKYCNKARKRVLFCKVCKVQLVDNSRKTCEKHIRYKVTKLEDAKSDGTRKKILLSERGYKCERCGITEWQGNRAPIELDHKDGNPDNNSTENLKLLCRNCHGITETFGAKIKSKAAKRCKIRRERYLPVKHKR